MIDTLVNLLFRCAHRRLTRPVTPIGKSGAPSGETYIVCLDCGKQFAYDVREMRIGKPIASSHDNGVLLPEPPGWRTQKKLKFALWASLPAAFLIGSALRPKKRPPPDAGTEKK